MSDTWKDTSRRSSSPLADVHVAGGVRYWRLTEWRSVDDVAARAARGRFRDPLEAQGVRTLERVLEVPGLMPGTTRVVVALFRDGEEAVSAQGARMRRERAERPATVPSGPLERAI